MKRIRERGQTLAAILAPRGAAPTRSRAVASTGGRVIQAILPLVRSSSPLTRSGGSSASPRSTSDVACRAVPRACEPAGLAHHASALRRLTEEIGRPGQEGGAGDRGDVFGRGDQLRRSVVVGARGRLGPVERTTLPGGSTSAIARWRSRSVGSSTARTTAARTSGCRKVILPEESLISPSTSAGSRSASETPSRAAAVSNTSMPSSSRRAASARAVREEVGSPTAACAKADSTSSPATSVGGSGSRPSRCSTLSLCGSSSRASGLPCAAFRTAGVRLVDRRCPRLEDRHRGGVVERGDVDDRLHDASELAAGHRPRRKDDRDAVRAEPPEDEAERVARRVVEPLDVVHQHEQRPPLGCGGEESEEPGGHRERLDARQVRREHRLQRGEPARWKPTQIVLQGAHQGEQPCVREVALGLRPEGTHGREPRRPRGGVEQSALADPRARRRARATRPPRAHVLECVATSSSSR